MTRGPIAITSARRCRALLVTAAAAAVVSGCPSPPPASTYVTVNPCTTSSAITCDPITGHVVDDPPGSPRGQLAVVFHGSGASPQAHLKLTAELSAAGFHVIALRYPGSVSTPGACPVANAASDPDCHRTFRGELTFGAGVNDPDGTSFDHPVLSVTRANSVLNRLLQLVAYLAGTYPTQGWDQFQAQSNGICTTVNVEYSACDLDWSKVVLMGHSLGSGEALFLSKYHQVDRVGLISGTFDQYVDGSSVTVAPWIAEGGFATPVADMMGLLHVNEWNVAGIVPTWNALGLAGPLTPTANASPPFGGSQQLTTAVTPACGLDSNGAHNSTAQDGCTPGSPATLAPVWRHLAGA